LPNFQEDARRANQALVELVGTLAEEHKATNAQIALAWLLNRKPWIVPIPGTTKLSRLEENIGAVRVKLSPEHVKSIDDAVAHVKVVGDRYTAAMQTAVNR
jgi:aryl-alcohol dehydrogenase-like predicted oxidoreductase